jgi:iron complex transport system substrate-binding protein
MKTGRWTPPFFVTLVVALCVLALAASGCGGKGGNGGRPTVYTDDLGRKVTIEKVPERIVSAAPANTEILFALGLGDKVVGVTKYCDYPPAAKKKHKIGEFSKLNVEAIVAAKPDLVLATGGVQKEVLGKLDDLAITVYAVDASTFDETVSNIKKIGTMTGAGDKADDIARDMENRAEKVRDAADRAQSEGEAKQRVFYEIFYEETGVWTAGQKGIISDLIKLAGGANIGDLEKSDYYQFNLETLFRENPDVYLVGSGAMSNPGDVAARPGWDNLKAVGEGRVYVINEDLIYRTGPRLIDGLEAVFTDLYPESND